MNRVYFILIILLFIHTISETCTIGVASGSVTTDGRPLIWKNRDVYTSVYVHYCDTLSNKFIGVGNENNEYIWMGVNEHGFAILNSLADFPDQGNGRMGNGDTMKHALANFSTVGEFEAFLDSTNITGRETHANMAVIDSTGAAKMYEVSEDNYWIFDTADAENSFVVRAVFALNGGGTTSPNYEASKAIIGDLVENNNLNVGNILHYNIREFSDHSTGEHIPVPYENRWDATLPFGYIQAQGICNNGNGSAVIIQGTLPDEPVDFTTMWTLLGQPSTTIAFPCFPVCSPPPEANNNGISTIYYQAYANQMILFDYMATIYVDTYKLINYNSTGYWTQIFPQEDDYISQVDSLKNYWSENSYEIDDIRNAQNDLAADALAFLQNAYIETEVIPDFRADIRYGLPGLEVLLEESSLHFPDINSWQWDFDHDATIDFDGIDTVWTYTEAGTYTVYLNVGNGEDSYQIIKEDYINVLNSIDEIINVEPDSLFFQTEEDAFTGLDITIHNQLAIDITIDSLYTECYYEPNDIEFPILIPDNEFIEFTIWVPMPVFDRDIICYYLYIYTSNGIMEYPIYVDTVIYNNVENEDIPLVNTYLSNFPNPFSSETTISFNCHRDTEDTEIVIYNIRGQKVRTLECNIHDIAASTRLMHSITWDGSDENRKFLSSGIYFYKLDNAEKSSQIRKMILIK